LGCSTSLLDKRSLKNCRETKFSSGTLQEGKEKNEPVSLGKGKETEAAKQGGGGRTLSLHATERGGRNKRGVKVAVDYYGVREIRWQYVSGRTASGREQVEEKGWNTEG